MKLFRFSIFFFIVPALLAGAQPNAKTQPGTKTESVVIRAGTLLDGKGHAGDGKGPRSRRQGAAPRWNAPPGYETLTAKPDQEMQR